MRWLTAFGFLAISGCPCFAQILGAPPIEVRSFDVPTIEKAIQCEIGRFARSVGHQTLDRDHQKAGYTISAKFQVDNSWKIGMPIFVPQGANDRGFAGTGTFKPFNVNVANESACPKKAPGLELLDLRECLAIYASRYSRTVSLECESHMHVKQSAGLGGKVTFFVTFDLNAGWGTDFTQTAKVVVPPPARRGQ